MTDLAQSFENGVLRTHSLYIQGLETRPLTIEVLKSRGLSQLALTGLPDSWLRDSRDKVKSLVGRMCRWGPLDRLLVHMLPVDEPKTGAHLELPIALACMASLCAEEMGLDSLDFLNRHKFVGALSLDGKILPTNMENLCRVTGIKGVIGADDFASLDKLWNHIVSSPRKPSSPLIASKAPVPEFLVPEILVEGREWEKFWLMMASILKFPVLLMGTPGLGKSLLARWSHALTVPEAETHSSEAIHIWQLSGLVKKSQIPLVEPHARAPLSEFVGVQRSGYAIPGYFSLAHGGLLILDEFAEMNRDCREILRNVLDQKSVTRNLRGGTITWPANFWLIATSNPCPCGYSKGQDFSKCVCPASVSQNYRTKLSGPIFERFAMRLFFKDAKDTKLFRKHSVYLLAKNFIDKFADINGLRQVVVDSRLQSQDYLGWAQKTLKSQSAYDGISFRELSSKTKLLSCLRLFFGEEDSCSLLEKLYEDERKDFLLKETFACL